MKENIKNEVIYNYESVIMIKPNVNQIDNIIKVYKDYFENIANNVEVENLGVRKLAYEVQGFEMANYVIFRYDTEQNKITDVERNFKQDDNVIKYMTIRNERVFDENIVKKAEVYNYELKQRVITKITDEYNDFIKNLKSERSEVIIERAYEKVCKEEMLYAFEKRDLSSNECKALLKYSNILDDCYDEWLKCDGNFNEMLEYAVDNSIKHTVNDFNKEKKQKSRDVR